MNQRELNGTTRARGAAGFSILQVVIIMAVIAITSTFGFIGIQKARASMRLSGAVRELAGHLERARTDSVRRRAQTGDESRVERLSSTSYRVCMDFDNSGTIGTGDCRTITFSDGVTFGPNVWTSIAFNWRGRPVGGEEVINLVNDQGGETKVDVTASGDMTIDSDVFQDLIPQVALNDTTTSTNVADESGTTSGGTNVNGNSNSNNSNTGNSNTNGNSNSNGNTNSGNGHGNGRGNNGQNNNTNSNSNTGNSNSTNSNNNSNTNTNTNTNNNQGGGQTSCTISTVSQPNPLTVSKNTGNNDTPARVAVSLSNDGDANTVTAAAVGADGASVSNLTISKTVTRGVAVFSVTSNNSTRGTFYLRFSAPCSQSSVSLSITVTN